MIYTINLSDEQDAALQSLTNKINAIDRRTVLTKNVFLQQKVDMLLSDEVNDVKLKTAAQIKDRYLAEPDFKMAIDEAIAKVEAVKAVPIATPPEMVSALMDSANEV
jgi:hypothetical protein